MATVDLLWPMASLTDLAERYVDDRLRRGEITEGTARNLASHLRHLADALPNVPLDRLDRDALERWQATIGHLKPASRRARLSTVRTFCRWLVDHGYIDTDPSVRLAKVRLSQPVPRALPARACAALLARVDDSR